jgi:hypothetical protein
MRFFLRRAFSALIPLTATCYAHTAPPQEEPTSPSPSGIAAAVRPAAPTDADRATLAAFGSCCTRVRGVAFPEGELMQMFESTPEGHVGKPRNNPEIAEAVTAGE